MQGDAALRRETTFHLRWFEGRVIQIQPVKNLVVIVTWRRRGLVRELHRVGAFEKKNRRIRWCELGMQSWIVERVVFVGQNLHGLSPLFHRRVGLRVP